MKFLLYTTSYGRSGSIQLNRPAILLPLILILTALLAAAAYLGYRVDHSDISVPLEYAAISDFQTGGFKVLSIGRVQGPALKMIVEREKEIQAFKPVPFWQIPLLGETKKTPIEAEHEKDKFWDKNLQYL